MEIVIIAAVVIAAIGWWIWKEGQHEKNGHPLDAVTKKMDVNHDGQVDVKDAVAVIAEVKETVVAVADVNKDGRVDTDDAKVVAETVKKTTKKAKAKVEETVAKIKKPRKTKAK